MRRASVVFLFHRFNVITIHPLEPSSALFPRCAATTSYPAKLPFLSKIEATDKSVRAPNDARIVCCIVWKTVKKIGR